MSEQTLERTARAADPGARPMEVLHVTEALAAGVGRSMARLVRLQTDEGARCTVVATRRYDTPDDDELRRWFGPGVELHLSESGSTGRMQLAWMAGRMRSLMAARSFGAVHLHSSFAGAVGRVVALGCRRRPAVFYSPHGFGFLRADLSTSRRRIVRAAEQLLARLPGRLVLVSPTELEVARTRVGSKVELLQNGVDLERCRASRPRTTRVRPRVVMVGRIAYQKAPWRFAEAARRLHHLADFQWLGYGEEGDRERWLAGSPVQVSGALTHDELLRRLGDADVVFFPTLWEGMPLSLIEAQACGVPVVASDINGNRDVVVDGVTGFLRADEEGMVDALEQVLREPSLRERLAVAAEGSARRFSDERRGAESLRIYRRWAVGG